MDTNQPTASPNAVSAPASPGVFGTKIPSSVAFIVAVLLFFMPFIDIKCNNMSLQQVSGLQLATGFKMKNKSSNNPFMDDIKSDGIDKGITKTTTKSDSKDPNLYAMIALGLGVLGVFLSFTNAKAAIGGAMITGIGSAGALIGLMLDIKKKIKMPSMTGTSAENGNGFSDKMNDFGKDLGEQINLSVDFTPWFYIAVLAFLAAAFLCYKRMQTLKT